jgi:hypothetical protein
MVLVDADGRLVVICFMEHILAHIPAGGSCAAAPDILSLDPFGYKAMKSENKTKIFVQRTEDIPRCGHWVILDNKSIYIPGDERSRSAPGHGYPESTERYVSYVAYLDREEFEEDLKRCSEDSEFTGRGIYVAGSYAIQRTVGLIPPDDSRFNTTGGFR